jgi:hypothetical protein
VILAPESFELWLAADVDARTAATMLTPAPEGLLEAFEVSTAVNHTANDSAQLIEPAAPDEPAGEAAQVSGAAPQSTAAARTKKARRKKDDDRQTSLF